MTDDIESKLGRARIRCSGDEGVQQVLRRSSECLSFVESPRLQIPRDLEENKQKYEFPRDFLSRSDRSPRAAIGRVLFAH